MFARITPAIVISVVVIAASARYTALRAGVPAPADLSSVRQRVQDLITSAAAGPVPDAVSMSSSDLRSSDLQALTGAGVERIVFERFDPRALVVIHPGADGQPGVSGADDNANGTVDERSELGATRSDDVCVVEPDLRANDDADRATLVLERGAFVRATWYEVREHASSSEGILATRAIVTGGDQGDRWSFLMAIPRS